jgi:uncharacterized protein YwbE
MVPKTTLQPQGGFEATILFRAHEQLKLVSGSVLKIYFSSPFHPH